MFLRNAKVFDTDHLLPNCGTGPNDKIIFSTDHRHSSEHFIIHFKDEEQTALLKLTVRTAL
jgi:hypothetical protein